MPDLSGPPVGHSRRRDQEKVETKTVDTITRAFRELGLCIETTPMLFPGGATNDLFRDERKICVRRPETAQVAVKRTKHDAPCAVHVPVNSDTAVRDRSCAAKVSVDEAIPCTRLAGVGLVCDDEPLAVLAAHPLQFLPNR